MRGFGFWAVCFTGLFTIAFSLSANAVATVKKTPPPLPMTLRKGFQISVDQWDEVTQTYSVGIVTEPGVGPNITTAAYLARAIDFQGTAADFDKQRGQMLGSIYTLDKDLQLISEKELAKRRKRGSPKKR